MKIFLDDERLPFDTRWAVVKNVGEFWQIAKNGNSVTEISFDHDLGENQLTGYDLINQMIDHTLDHPGAFNNLQSITIHSANIVGIKNMEGLFSSAMRAGIFPSLPITIRSALDNPYRF